jgi:hypothetical protein
VLAIAEVANPGLQRGRVVLLDDSAVGLDGGVTGDGRPLARVGDEANVDRGIFLQVVGLARLCVGVKEEIEAVALLLCISFLLTDVITATTDLCCQSHSS